MLKILEQVEKWDWCLGSDCTESEPWIFLYYS